MALAAIGCDVLEDDRIDIFQPSPCAPPCWQNITPGRTRFDEAIAALDSNPWIGQHTALDNKAIMFDGDIGGEIELQEGIVESIYVSVNRSRRKVKDTLQMDELLQQYGSPLIKVHAVSDGGSQMSLGVFIYYPQIGLFIVTEFEAPSHSDPVLPSTLNVFSVEYLRPDKYFQLLGSDGLSECLVPWAGYKESSYYCVDSCESTPVWSELEGCPPLK